MMSSKYLSMCWVSRMKTTTRKVRINGPIKELRISLSSFFIEIMLEIVKNYANMEMEMQGVEELGDEESSPTHVIAGSRGLRVTRNPEETLLAERDRGSRSSYSACCPR